MAILAQVNTLNATVTLLTGSSSRAASRERAEVNGWTARRHEVIERDSGVCAFCGREAADTATHSLEVGDLVAAHTRCVVGLGPPVVFAWEAA